MDLTFLHKIVDLDPIDAFFGEFAAQLATKSDIAVATAAALAQHAPSLGDICCDLHAWCGRELTDTEGRVLYVCPAYRVWEQALLASGVVKKPGGVAPLILDGNGYLYLYAYYLYQQKILDVIEQNSSVHLNKSVFRVGEVAKRLFEFEHVTHLDVSNPDQRQLLAALNCVLNPFAVISGGPGTGKTTTVARILALLLELRLVRPGRIMLAAPTGKAAARLGEAISQAKSGLRTAPQILEGIPEQASTIHRLLAQQPHIDAPAGLGDNLFLPADLVVVDEASMADIELLYRLLMVMGDKCRFIMVGDHAQLAAVGAGSALSDICGETSRDTAFSPAWNHVLQTVYRADGNAIADLNPRQKLSQPADSVVYLTRNYRFKDSSAGLNAVTQAVRAGNARKVLELLNNSAEDLSLQNKVTPAEMPHLLEPLVRQYYAAYLAAATPAEALAQFEYFRILCALKDGPFGVNGLNKLCERLLRDSGAIRQDGAFYHGRPVIIGVNDYRLRLFNGDIGLAWQSGPDEALRVYFHDYQQGGLRAFSTFNLPGHDTAWAMTVHRSQGSEFNHILLVLPDKENRVLNRELVYTGLSRARKKAEVWSPEAVLVSSIRHVSERKSGLKQALQQGGN